jgi:hypothetical protein
VLGRRLWGTSDQYVYYKQLLKHTTSYKYEVVITNFAGLIDYFPIYFWDVYPKISAQSMEVITKTTPNGFIPNFRPCKSNN